MVDPLTAKQTAAERRRAQFLAERVAEAEAAERAAQRPPITTRPSASRAYDNHPDREWYP